MNTVMMKLLSWLIVTMMKIIMIMETKMDIYSINGKELTICVGIALIFSRSVVVLYGCHRMVTGTLTRSWCFLSGVPTLPPSGFIPGSRWLVTMVSTVCCLFLAVIWNSFDVLWRLLFLQLICLLGQINKYLVFALVHIHQLHLSLFKLWK